MLVLSPLLFVLLALPTAEAMGGPHGTSFIPWIGRNSLKHATLEQLEVAITENCAKIATIGAKKELLNEEIAGTEVKKEDLEMAIAQADAKIAVGIPLLEHLNGVMRAEYGANHERRKALKAVKGARQKLLKAAIKECDAMIAALNEHQALQAKYEQLLEKKTANDG